MRLLIQCYNRSNTRFPPDALISKIDIKDSYMEGEPDQLVHNAFDFEDSLEKENAMRKLCWTYLDQQCVKSQSGQLYTVRVGAGMGATGSAEIADTCFYNLSERFFVLNKRIWDRYGILYYGRYRDDICIIHNKPLRFLFI